MSSGVVQVAEEAGFLLATRRRRLAMLLPKVLWRPSEIVLSREDYELDQKPGKKHKLNSDGKVEKQKQTESAWIAGEVCVTYQEECSLCSVHLHRQHLAVSPRSWPDGRRSSLCVADGRAV